DPKYAAAFTINAMSDDEDDPAPTPGEAQRYISRRPWYRSDELQSLFEAVDRLPDPDPDLAKKMTTRVPGEEKQKVEPARARTLKTRLRAWMIKHEAMTANPHWMTSGRVASSGKAWGDAEDPVDVVTKGKGKAGGNLGVKFRRTEETADVKAARERYAQLTEGRDVEAMFQVM
ncbi:hypothetical protein BV20DRAFT_944167, partial [Pilatotrama ljubarskyi]